MMKGEEQIIKEIVPNLLGMIIPSQKISRRDNWEKSNSPNNIVS